MTARHKDHPIPANCAEPLHLGDGAYVSHDGYQLWISCDREFGFHAVAVEVGAVDQLVDYVKRVRGFHG